MSTTATKTEIHQVNKAKKKHKQKLVSKNSNPSANLKG
jgi:hypothetical protein